MNQFFRDGNRKFPVSVTIIVGGKSLLGKSRNFLCVQILAVLVTTHAKQVMIHDNMITW